jgi:ABC-type amino acid transport substrate-binding protein
MFTRHFRWIFLSFIIFIAPSAVAQTKPTVRLFLQENLDAQGRQIPLNQKLLKILKYFERESDLKFDPVILPWKRAQQETLAGKGIIYGFSKSVERVKYYHFSQPVITERVWAITYGSPKPKYLVVNDLKGKTVSIGRGFSHGLEFDQARDSLFTVQEDSASVADRFKKLIAKRSDLMVWPVREFTHTGEVEKYINEIVVPEAGDPDLKKYHFDVSEVPLFYDTVHFASPKGQYLDVIDKIDQVILRGSKNGSLNKVLKGYH